MKVYFILALASVLILTSCRQQPASVYLGGSFDEFEAGDKLILYRSSDRVSYRDWMCALDTSEISSSGEFSFTFSTVEPDFYQVVGGEGRPLFEDIYLEPGDSLIVHIPVKSDTTRITYTGAYGGAYAGHDLLDSLWQNDTIFKKSYYDVARMDIDSAWAFLSNRHATRMSVLNTHFKEHPEWEPIARMLTSNMTYRSAKDHYNYLYYHNYYSNDTFLYLIPEIKYYTFVDTMDMTPPDHYSFDYTFFMTAYLRDHLNRDYASLDDSTKFANGFSLELETAKKHLSGKALDQAMLAISTEFPMFLSEENFFEELDEMDSFFSTNHYALDNYTRFQYMRSQFDKLRPGNPAPEIALPNVNGDTVKLSDHLGKAIYIDFWGTWCFPCLQELPHSLELQEKFNGDPVEFIYVGLESGDDQVSTWRDFILGKRSLSYAPFLEQREYPGTHLLAEGQFNNPALSPYMLRMAPTYVLVDSKGLLVSANAPRPSSAGIEDMIRDAVRSE